MKRLETRLDGPILIEPRVLGDERGFFCETYRREVFAELGIPEEMVQDNHSRSRKGIVRGMHFQIGQGAAKLVRCARGAIVDVVVDIRRGSPTFGQWEAFELTEENMHIGLLPDRLRPRLLRALRRRRRHVQAEQLLRRRDRARHRLQRSRRGDRVAAAGRGADPLPARRHGAAAARHRGRAAVRLRRAQRARCTRYAAPSDAIREKKRRAADRSSGWMGQSKQQRVLAVASSGGHWVQLRRLAPAFEDHDVAYLTTDPGHRSEVGDARFYTVNDANRWNKLALVRCALKDSLGAAPRAPDRGRLDRRGSRLPGDPARHGCSERARCGSTASPTSRSFRCPAGWRAPRPTFA